METNKIALLVGVIVVALAVLGFVIYKSNPTSGTVQAGEIKHVTAAVRERHVRGSQNGGAGGYGQVQQMPGGAAQPGAGQ